MNYIFKIISGGTAVVAAETKEKAIEIMKAIYGKNEFEIAS